jgi:hypothetical protein
MRAMIAPYGCFDVPSALLTSSDEVVVLCLGVHNIDGRALWSAP